MRKIFLLIWLFCLCFVNSVYAADYTLNKELTWDQVKGGTTAFALVSGSDVLYGTDQQNLAFGPTSSAMNEANSVGVWKVESAGSSVFYFRGYNLTGGAHTAFGSPAYLNSQPSIGGVTFVLNNQNADKGYTGGQDMNNGAVWTVTAVSGGYTIRNNGNNGYLAGATTTSTAEKVWKFYSVKGGREDFVFTGYDANPGYTLRPIRQYGKNLVYADDVNHKVTLHGVMDTPNRYFNNDRWSLNWSNPYNNDDDVRNCLAYFETTLSAYTNHQAGSYCDVFRLHLDPAWTNDPNKTATGSGQENDISRFSADRLKTYMDKLYWPIAKKAIDKGMYVIMRPPGVCPQKIQIGGEYQQYLKTVWDIVSSNENVKKYAGMIMIELANEPIEVLDRDGVNSYGRASVLHDFFQPIVDVIRANGFKGIILSSGATWQQSYQGYGTNPITGDNIGYAVHWYPGWYSTKHYKENVDNQTVISHFRNNIPVVESRPIVVTEVDWSPEQVPQVLDHKDENGNNVYKNYGTWATGTTTSFGKNFKAVHDYFGNISMTLTHPYEYVDFDQLFNNNKVTYSFQNMAEPKEACAYTCFVDWYPKLYEDHSIGGNGLEATGEMFSLATADVNPSIWEKGIYSYDNTEKVGTLYTGQYGFGGWQNEQGYDVSDYESVTVEFAEAPTSCSFRLFKVNDYWTGSDNIIDTDCTGKTSVTVDISDIDKVYIAGFWTLGNAAVDGTINYVNHPVKIKSITLNKKTVHPITEPIELVFTEEGSKTFDIRYFKVSGEGVTIDYNTGLVTATQAGGKMYVEFNNADLSAAQSIKLNVNTSDPNVDICNTGAIYNNGTSINEWYGSRYNMQDLDKTAKIDDVDQDYIWNEKMGSVTKLEWNIDKAGMMTINDLIITSGVPASVAPDPENPDIPEIAQRRPVDNKHPLWLVHVDVWNNADPQKIIDLIPEDIKPYVAMNLSLSCSYDDDLSMFMKPQNAIQTFRSWASVCCRNNMFFTCQPASGGRGHLPDDDAHLQETLTTMESFFKDYPNFLGWNYAEQFWGFDDNSVSSSKAVDRIRLFSKLVPMHAKYGGFLTISFCGNIWSHPTNPIGMMKRNSDFLNACKANPEATLWLYKYTTSANWYNNESVTIGPFISGLSNNYGVRYDNCGWNEAIKILVKDDKAEYKNDGLPETYPGAVGIAPILEQSALNGACVWDGPELIWTECFQNKRDSNVEGYTQRNWGTFPNFDNIWVDMFRKIIDGTIHIPSRDEVLARTKVVMKNDISANDDATRLKINAYAAPIDLYHDLYWQDDPFNARDSNEGGIGKIAGYGNNNYLYFKKTGRYATIPIVIDMFDDKAKNAGIKVINRSDYNANHSNKVDVFNQAYPDPVIDEGDLFVARHKNALVCYYPFSDRKKESNGEYKTTSYAKVPLKYNTCTSMDLTFGVFSSAHAKEYSDHIDFYMNNFRDDIGNDGVKTDVIKINGASAKPSYTVVSNRCNATVTENWSNGVYTCTVTHCGPLDLRINCAGNNSRSPLAMVDDAPLDASSIATADAEELKMQPLVIEGEDFDYKSVAHCVTDAYNYNEGSYRNVLGHAAMGFQDMGTNTAATLRKKTAINNSGEYNIGVKYMSLDASNISVVVNGKSYSVPVDSTANAITDAKAWRSAEITAELIKGQNDVVISNAGGKRLMVDNVTFTPLSLYEIAEPNSFDLSAHDFYNWTAADATGTKKGSAGCAYVLNESTGMPYGDGNVAYLNYADLSQYQIFSLTLAQGSAAPRILMNRDTEGGQAPDHLINVPENSEQKAKYITEITNIDGSVTYNVNLAKIVADYGYAHLHAVKSYGQITATSMKLYKVYGDVNGDGKVGVSDLATLIDLLGGKEHKNAQGDLSGDGKVDTTDVSILVNILLDQNE